MTAAIARDGEIKLQARVGDVAEATLRRVANHTYAKLQEVNVAEKLAGRLPDFRIVEDWIAQAKALPKMLEY